MGGWCLAKPWNPAKHRAGEDNSNAGVGWGLKLLVDPKPHHVHPITASLPQP